MNPRAFAITTAPGAYEVHDASGYAVGILYRVSAGKWFATRAYGFARRAPFATQRAALAWVLSR